VRMRRTPADKHPLPVVEHRAGRHMQALRIANIRNH
jgi:hypothetical protein